MSNNESKNNIRIKLATVVVIVVALIGATSYIHIRFALASDVEAMEKKHQQLEIEVTEIKSDLKHIKNTQEDMEKQQKADTKAILDAIRR
jgi:outer membrane murein-binding lipoprotein Lpp